ncbi:hypothetical protein AYI70_g5134 [Smittium culicis]|uniref:Uncharacterized protein n=1 Tax=Smittium culicis TaxID=133412 RepID=A0A1R1XW19_9FUNG|nr:hypothetical protein AYI70_g5134 [Smittium culicis]
MYMPAQESYKPTNSPSNLYTRANTPINQSLHALPINRVNNGPTSGYSATRNYTSNKYAKSMSSNPQEEMKIYGSIEGNLNSNRVLAGVKSPNILYNGGTNKSQNSLQKDLNSQYFKVPDGNVSSNNQKYLLDCIPGNNSQKKKAINGLKDFRKAKSSSPLGSRGVYVNYIRKDNQPFIDIKDPITRFEQKAKKEPPRNYGSLRDLTLSTNSLDQSKKYMSSSGFNESKFSLKSEHFNQNNSIVSGIKKVGKNKQPSERTLINSNFAKNSEGDFVLYKEGYNSPTKPEIDQYGFLSKGGNHNISNKYGMDQSYPKYINKVNYSSINKTNPPDFKNLNEGMFNNYSRNLNTSIQGSMENPYLYSSIPGNIQNIPKPRYKMHPASMKNTLEKSR